MLDDMMVKCNTDLNGQRFIGYVDIGNKISDDFSRSAIDLLSSKL